MNSFNKMNTLTNKTYVNNKTFMTHGIQTWTLDNVIKWMEMNELNELISLFVYNAVDGNALYNITESELITMGVDKIGQRKKILRLVQEHNSLLDTNNINDTLTIKVIFDSRVRTINVTKNNTYNKIVNIIQKEYNLYEISKILYKDENGNKVTITDDIQMLNFITGTNKSKKLYVREKRMYKTKQFKNNFDMFNALLQPIIITNQHGIIEYINQKFTEKFMYSIKDLIGKNVKTIILDLNTENNDKHNVFVKIKSGTTLQMCLDLTRNTALGTNYI